jgi:probable F420-dependent oxidoreductase
VHFTMSVALSNPREYAALAVAAEECGYHQIAVPDSIFWSESVSNAYPYTKDGSRLWNERTAFVDPFVAVASMAAVTSRIRFVTAVVKVAVRNPILLAKQISSVAVLSDNRFTFGAGVGWLKEEFEWSGGVYEGRGLYTDESLDAVVALLTGDWVERDGEMVKFGLIKQPPAPTERVPIWIGGHTPVALRRTVRFGDGWTSAMMGIEEFREVRGTLEDLMATAGRSTEGFEYQISPNDRFGLEGYKELAEAGATDVVTVPWMFYGVPWDGPLEDKLYGIRRFAKEVIDAW